MLWILRLVHNLPGGQWWHTRNNSTDAFPVCESCDWYLAASARATHQKCWAKFALPIQHRWCWQQIPYQWPKKIIVNRNYMCTGLDQRQKLLILAVCVTLLFRSIVIEGGSATAWLPPQDLVARTCPAGVVLMIVNQTYETGFCPFWLLPHKSERWADYHICLPSSSFDPYFGIDLFLVFARVFVILNSGKQSLCT